MHAPNDIISRRLLALALAVCPLVACQVDETDEPDHADRLRNADDAEPILVEVTVNEEGVYVVPDFTGDVAALALMEAQAARLAEVEDPEIVGFSQITVQQSVAPDAVLNEGEQFTLTLTATDAVGVATDYVATMVVVSSSGPEIVIDGDSLQRLAAGHAFVPVVDVVDQGVLAAPEVTATIDEMPYVLGEQLVLPAGMHTLTITAQDARGQEDSVSRVFRVDPLPTFDAELALLDSQCKGTPEEGYGFSTRLAVASAEFSELDILPNSIGLHLVGEGGHLGGDEPLRLRGSTDPVSGAFDHVAASAYSHYVDGYWVFEFATPPGELLPACPGGVVLTGAGTDQPPGNGPSFTIFGKWDDMGQLVGNPWDWFQQQPIPPLLPQDQGTGGVDTGIVYPPVETCFFLSEPIPFSQQEMDGFFSDGFSAHGSHRAGPSTPKTAKGGGLGFGHVQFIGNVFECCPGMATPHYDLTAVPGLTVVAQFGPGDDDGRAKSGATVLQTNEECKLEGEFPPALAAVGPDPSKIPVEFDFSYADGKASAQIGIKNLSIARNPKKKDSDGGLSKKTFTGACDQKAVKVSLIASYDAESEAFNGIEDTMHKALSAVINVILTQGLGLDAKVPKGPFAKATLDQVSHGLTIEATCGPIKESFSY